MEFGACGGAGMQLLELAWLTSLYRLTLWSTGADEGRLFTCARPGRSKGTHLKTISDDLVHRWVEGLPGDRGTCIVSLLGRKPDPGGRSEFAFYSFRGGFDSAIDRPECPTFQEWLDSLHQERNLKVFEYPTIDLQPLQPVILEAVLSQIRALLAANNTVVLVDSGGVGRTGRVCKALGFIPVERKTRGPVRGQ